MTLVRSAVSSGSVLSLPSESSDSVKLSSSRIQPGPKGLGSTRLKTKDTQKKKGTKADQTVGKPFLASRGRRDTKGTQQQDKAYKNKSNKTNLGDV